MTTLRIDVQSRDILFKPEIFGYGKPIVIGDKVEVAEGVTFRLDAGIESRGLDIPAVFHFTLEIAAFGTGSVIFGIISDWLYDKFKGHVHPEYGDKFTIERTEVEMEAGAIKRVLTEKVTLETSHRPKKP